MYVKGQDSFVIEETRNEYKVYCSKNVNTSTSRNKNIADRQLRMKAIDLMGAYILFKSSAMDRDLGPEYFQVYADGINLHYNAYLEGIKQENVTFEGQQSICFSCNKTDYLITEASYKDITDLSALLESNYSQNKGEKAANLLYRFPEIDSAWYLGLERDYLSGNAQLPSEIRRLQSVSERFEFSVFGIGDDFPVPNKSACHETLPYSYFFFEEIVTAAPLDEKEKAYSEWRHMIEPHNIYEEILLFCSSRCRSSLPSKNEVTLSSVIEAFPGAVSPFAIRQPTNDDSYHRGAAAYSKSDFSSSAEILQETIDNEGISAPVLNLLGASYRYLGHPEKALPYLLLCLKINPETPYLAGNMYLCLSLLKFPETSRLKNYLSSIAKDNWSKDVLNN